MLYVIITLSLLSVMYVDGIEPETDLPPTVAVSSQSYHRGDVPLSYSITSYHNYTTIKPKSRAPVYGVNNHILEYKPQPIFNSQINQPPIQLLHPSTETTDNAINYNFNEPLANHEPFRNVLTSFRPGQNMAFVPRFKYQTSILNDLFQNYYVPQKIVPKHIIQAKQIEPLQTQISKTDLEPKHLQKAANPLFPFKNVPGRIYVSKNVHTHNENLFPQQPPPRAPRLHLNIARVYGVAHIPHQAPESVGIRDKPLSHTQAIIGSRPQLDNQGNTLLYPMKNYKRNPTQVG